MSAIVALTAQNTVGVIAVHEVPASFVIAQIEAVFSDIGVDAVKTGMLGSGAVAAAVADALAGIGPLVVDPVVRSTSGAALVDDAGLDVYRGRLLPLATLVTPNFAEAAVLTGLPVDDRRGMVAAAEALVAMGAGAALVTGGHLPGDTVADCLVTRDRTWWWEAPRLVTRHTHGTGCVLSAAITARLARGDALVAAVRVGRGAVRRAIRAGVAFGSGDGPVDPGRGR